MNERSALKICVVTPQPTPYRDPFWNTVAEQPGVELDVFYCYAKGEDRPWEINWPWKFHGEVLPGRPLLGNHNGYWNPSILRKLRAKSYDAIILGGYNHLTMLAAARYAQRHGIPYFVMCESFHRLKRPGYRRWLKTPLVRWFVGRAAGILPTGSLACEYLISYGGRADRCVYVPNSPDLLFLREEAGRLRSDRATLRKQLGIGPGPAVLFVGRLIRKKGVDILIEAVGKLRNRWAGQLIVVGDGPEQQLLIELTARLGLTDRVWFVGFRQPRELPQWYCGCDLFVLPSRSEPWGVVVMEALACGIPVVVTDRVGCYPDVIPNKRVGRVVPAEDVAALAEAIAEMLSDLPSAEEVNSLWEPIFSQLNHQEVASRLINLVSRVVNGDKPGT